MHYANIEIGTSDFRTLIGNRKGNGISIEPVPCYFNNLPNAEGWVKLNCAVSDRDGKATIYYVNPDKITTEPNWVRGCNSIGNPHPTIKKDYPHLMDCVEVDVISVETLIETCDITSVDYLKIDTEGHDITILKALLKTNIRPKYIQFESNILTDRVEYIQIIQSLYEYKTKRERFDTLCEFRHMERTGYNR